MRAHVLACLTAFVCPVIGAAQTPTSQPPANPLPVRRVVLYKTGVGFFEHQGQVRGRENVTIRFTSRQLNDVLKSLTTIDPKGQITGISYNSVAPLDERLRALRLPLGPAGTAFDLMATLRGARIEVAVGTRSGPVLGRLLSVERRVQRVGDKDREAQEFSIVTDAGLVRSFELTPAVSVRVVERDMQQEIGRYLDVIGSTREQDVRNVVISTAGAGARPLFVSYVSEVPIWKSTYRLVLPASGRPFLQGWAVVDNTVGEDWTNVELSLVAGAPQSFIQRLSQPLYGQRPVVPIPTGVLTSPQTHSAGLAGGTASTVTQPGAGSVARRLEGGVPGGSMGGVVGGLPSPPPPPAAMPSEMLREVAPVAQAGSLGDLFEYRIKEPVTLRKNQSALVPIINADITAEKVSIWNRGAASGHPLRAIWLTNTTGLTLDGGSFTVIDAESFAGEGLIDSLVPSAKRLVSYAEDRSLVVNGELSSAPYRTRRVRARDGILIHETEERATWTYSVRNEDDAAATLIVEHRHRQGWTLAEGQSPVETAPNAPRFRVPIEGRKEGKLTVTEVRGQETRISLADLDDGLLVGWEKSGIDPRRIQAALAPVLAKKTELAAAEARQRDLNDKQAAIVSDQQRLRENMRALRGSAEEKLLLQRYTRQLDEQENALESLRQQILATTTRHEELRRELAALIANLTFDVER